MIVSLLIFLFLSYETMQIFKITSIKFWSCTFSNWLAIFKIQRIFVDQYSTDLNNYGKEHYIISIQIWYNNVYALWCRHVQSIASFFLFVLFNKIIVYVFNYIQNSSNFIKEYLDEALGFHFNADSFQNFQLVLIFYC